MRRSKKQKGRDVGNELSGSVVSRISHVEEEKCYPGITFLRGMNFSVC